MPQTTPRPVSFGVLGPLLVEIDGTPTPVGGLKPRIALAMLLLNAGRTVAVDRLIDGLWDQEPPGGAVNTLQAHISHLRRLLAPGDVAILTQPPGYQLRADAGQLDLFRFEDLTGTARDHAAAGRRAQAVALLDEALDLWRGPALEDLGAGTFAENARTYLEERRLGVIDDQLRLLVGLHRYREVVETCETLLATNPLREALWEVLMVALYRSGRQAEALARYRDCRTILLDELGVEPMPRLAELEAQILNHDRRLDPGSRTAALVVPAAGPATVTGTATELRPQRLDAVLVLPDDSVVPLAHRTVLGRHPDCDIVLDDGAVSRRHAEIRLANGRHIVLDLSSSNGTWLDGRPVMQHLLEDGDVLGLGDHQLRYRTRPTADPGDTGRAVRPSA